MHLTVLTWDDRCVNVQVDAGTTIADVKAILEAETGMPIAQQALVYGARMLRDSETLGAAGVADGDVLQVMPQPQQQQQQQQQRQPQGQRATGGSASASMEMNPDGSAKNPAALMAHIRGNPDLLRSIEGNAQLAQAVRDEDISAFQQALRSVHSAKTQHDAELNRLYALAEADPMDPEVQRKIEELIQQKNIQESYENAMEHAPETVVGSIHMLYVDMEVNGVSVKAFVDSGAQMTIMTQEFAEKCYLTRLIDKRFHGMAMGVGTSRIVGRIHQAPMRVGGHFIATSITVLEQKSGPQCCIDLRANVLAFGSCDAKLPFLSERDIPVDFSRHIEETSEEEAKRNMEGSARQDGAGSSAAAQPVSGSQAPAAAPAAAPSPASVTGDPKLDKLMALGFSKEQCEAALRMAGGNEEYAASVLFDQM